MCKCFTKTKTAKIGMMFNIVVFILIIPAIFITGFDYRQTDLMWMDEGPYYHLAIIKVSAVVAVVISFVLGIVAFMFIHTKVYQIIYRKSIVLPKKVCKVFHSLRSQILYNLHKVNRDQAPP